jgi:hypothetical protein
MNSYYLIEIGEQIQEVILCMRSEGQYGFAGTI